MKFNDQELMLIANALEQWANFIETGSLTLSAKDAKQSKKPFNALETEQMRTVVQLRDLVKRCVR